jgi:hypothetical protein
MGRKRNPLTITDINDVEGHGIASNGLNKLVASLLESG